MRGEGRILATLALVLGVACGCTTKPKVTDTGYVGTWARGTAYARRITAIARQGERYLFRPSVRSEDGNWEIRCGWDGTCEEWVDHKKTSDYSFRTWIDPETSHLMVECKGNASGSEPLAIHYVDELVVQPDGRTMVAFTHERAGQKFEGAARPQYTYTKVSDTIADPPRPAPGAP